MNMFIKQIVVTCSQNINKKKYPGYGLRNLPFIIYCHSVETYRSTYIKVLIWKLNF